MSVVLRCPNCGTTQTHPGECDACSEGEVQYFCTNHEEGIWLGDPVCSRCGAKFGDPPRRPAPAPTPTRPAVESRSAGVPDFRAPAGRRPSERTAETDFRSRAPRPPGAGDAREPEVLPPGTSLRELLEALSAARARRRVPDEAEETPWAGPPRRGLGFPLAGCLIRLLGLGLLLLLAFVIFLFVLFGGLVGG